MWALSAEFPLIDVALLRLPAVNRVAIVQLLSGFGTFATFVAVPVMIQAPNASGGLGLDATASGHALGPSGICCIVSQRFVASLRLLFGSAMELLAAGLVSWSRSAFRLVIGGGDLVVGVGMRDWRS